MAVTEPRRSLPWEKGLFLPACKERLFSFNFVLLGLSVVAVVRVLFLTDFEFDVLSPV